MNATTAPSLRPAAAPEAARQPAVPRERRIPQLDGLRGIAILLVVLYHYVSMPNTGVPGKFSYALEAATRIGWSGVDLFFVLSGFLIGGILLDARESPNYYRTFYLRRVHRIFPLYYTWIAIYFAVAFSPLVRFVPAEFIAAGNWKVALGHIFFVQNLMWTRSAAYHTVWMSALWSLAVEEQFYLVTPAVVRLISRRTLVRALLLLIAGGPLIRFLVHRFISPTHGAATYILTPCRADDLAMGVLLAVVWRSDRAKEWLRDRKWVIYASVAVFGAIYVWLDVSNASPYELPMAIAGFSSIGLFFSSLLILALLSPFGLWSRICQLRFLIQLGGISYCVYIIHGAVAYAWHQFLLPSPAGVATLRSAAATLLAAVSAWFLAKLSWRALESPMIRRGHQFKY